MGELNIAKNTIYMYPFSAWCWIKGTVAHREAAPASEIHPVTYGTSLPLRFFPSDTVNEGIFSFSRILREKCSFRTRLPPAKWRRRAHSSISAKTYSSQDSLTGQGPRLTTMLSSFYFYPSLMSSATRFMSQRPKLGCTAYLDLRNLQVICVSWPRALITPQVSFMSVFVCLSTSTTHSGRN